MVREGRYEKEVKTLENEDEFNEDYDYDADEE